MDQNFNRNIPAPQAERFTPHPSRFQKNRDTFPTAFAQLKLFMRAGEGLLNCTSRSIAGCAVLILRREDDILPYGKNRRSVNRNDINPDLRRRLSLSRKPSVPTDKVGSLRSRLHGYGVRGGRSKREPSWSGIHKGRDRSLCAVRAGQKIR